MPTPLTDSELDHLLKFVGYGNLNANVWFLGMEEAGGGEDNLRRRLKFKEVEDCAEAHGILGIRKHHWGKKTIQRTWRGMCCIMLELDGEEITTENIRSYQAEVLGRFAGRTLLTELMPIPKPAINEWGYESLLPQFSSAEDYYRRVKPKRIQQFRQLIDTHQPSIVIGYGKKYWLEYKELFPDLLFNSAGQFEIARDSKTSVLLADHFTARTMNSKFGEIVKLLKADQTLPA